MDIPFLPGELPESSYPLDAFLPPTPRGTVQSWLNNNIENGKLIIDPLGTDLFTPLEIALSGYRVLVICNNPVIRFLLALLSNDLNSNMFQAALSELSFIKRGDERLDQHLMAVYETICASCGKTIPVEAFIWERGGSSPSSRFYKCTYCGDQGERDLSKKDLIRNENYKSATRYRYQALQRLYGGDNLKLPGAEDAISQYTPRQLYFIFTLLNKLDSHNFSDNQRRRLLQGLILYMFQESGTIWSWPSERKRPKILSTPQYYRENNAWLSLERGMDLYIKHGKKVQLYNWPKIPSANESGICIYPGRISEFQFEPMAEIIDTAVAVIPRLNQAFWTLSALWAGWLWGKEDVTSMIGALKRKRYDWNWHNHALHTTFTCLKNIQTGPFKVFCILPEYEPDFFSSTLIALDKSGFSTTGLALRHEEKLLQIQMNSENPPHKNVRPAEIVCREAIYDYLSNCNEPKPYENIDTLCKLNIINHNALPQTKNDLTFSEISDLMEKTVNELTADDSYLININDQPENHHKNRLWLLEPPDNQVLSISDNVELALIKLLLSQAKLTLLEIDRWLCNIFMGLFTPELSLLLALLDSYGIPSKDNPPQWMIRKEDVKPGVSEEYAKSKRNLIHLCEALDLKLNKNNDRSISYSGNNGIYNFYIQTTCILSDIFLQKSFQLLTHNIILMPERRNALFEWKLSNDLRLQKSFNNFWHLLTFEEIDVLITLTDLSEDAFFEYLETEIKDRNDSFQMDIFSKNDDLIQ